MTDEYGLNLLEKLMETNDREESIKIAHKLFPEMPLDKLIEVVDESLAGYRETSTQIKQSAK